MTIERTSGAVVDTGTPASRRIVRRTAGHGHGGITRLMSPGDLGELVKPFVFLDHFEFQGAYGPMLPMHPHSGIATHTTLLEGSLEYADSTGKAGALPPRSVEWMQAGGGVWHTGRPVDGAPVRGFQLWMALPTGIELAAPESRYVEPEAIHGDGRVRVLLGSFGELRSPIPFPWPVTYLHVTLRDGERWSFQPPEGHDVAWLAVSVGALRVGDVGVRHELAVFEPGEGRIDLIAEGDTELVIGSAAKHPHPLVLGPYSVHTSPETLRQGLAGIRRVAAGLRDRR